MKILYVKNTVKEVLTEKPETRDCDNLLLFAVWEKFDNFSSLSSFKKAILNKELPHFESIRRARQKLQAKYPELRGNRYYNRQIEQVKETREELGYLETPFNAKGMTP